MTVVLAVVHVNISLLTDWTCASVDGNAGGGTQKEPWGAVPWQRTIEGWVVHANRSLHWQFAWAAEKLLKEQVFKLSNGILILFISIVLFQNQYVPVTFISACELFTVHYGSIRVHFASTISEGFAHSFSLLFLIPSILINLQIMCFITSSFVLLLIIWLAYLE